MRFSFLKPSPIQRKLVWLMMLTSVSSVLLSILILRINAWPPSERNASTLTPGDAKLSPEQLEILLGEKFSFSDPKNLRALGQNERINAGYLYDDKGKITSDYQRAGTSGRASEDVSDQIDSGLITSYELAEQSGESISTLVLLSDGTPYSPSQSSMRGALILALSASTLFAYLFSSLIQNKVSKPIRSLVEIPLPTADAVRIPANDPSARNRDELDTISERMYRMATVIESHNNARQFAHKEIEQRVDLRTRSLKAAKDAAEKATKIKSQFLANISHELRTPMHGILSYSNFGVKKSGQADREKLQKYFEKIQKSGQTLLDLLNDILDLAKLEAGRTKFEFKAEGILPVVKDAIDEYSALVEERDLSVRITESEDSVVFMDRKRILQVARNILNNAIKYSPAGTEIQVRVRRIGGTAAVEVRDHGEGVPAEDLDEIFEKFVQANDKQNVGGTGLGLAICKEIINSHNGDIWVYNHPAGGAVFIFSLPFAAINGDSGSTDGAAGGKEAERLVSTADNEDAGELVPAIRDVESQASPERVT